MADERQDLDLQNAARRATERAREYRRDTFDSRRAIPVARQDLRERALQRNWAIKRDGAGRELVDRSLHAFVRSGVTHHLWQKAIGKSDSGLEAALAAFLTPDAGRPTTANDLVEAAYHIASRTAPAPGAPVQPARDGRDTGAWAQPARRPGTRESRPGSNGAGRAAEADLQRALARRDALVGRLKKAIDGDGSALFQLHAQLTLLNTQIARLTPVDAEPSEPRSDLETVSSHTGAARELRAVVDRISRHLAAATPSTGTVTQASDAPAPSRVASRAFLRHIRQNGVRLRNHVVPVEAIHRDLGRAIDTVTTTRSGARPANKPADRNGQKPKGQADVPQRRVQRP